MAEGTPDDLGGDDTGTRISVQTAGEPPPAMDGAKQDRDGHWQVIVDDPVPMLRELTEWAETGGHELPGLQVTRRSLEDVYLDLTADARPPSGGPEPVAASSRRGARRGSMSAIALAVRQARFEQISFWRNPAAAFFTFAMPVLFLVVITALLGNDTATLPNGDEVAGSTYYIGSILSFSVVTATFTNLAMGTTFARDMGILKRIRATPMPAAAYLAGRVLSSLAVTILLIVLVIAFGALVYDVALPTDTMVPFLVTTAVGAAAFCALGLAVTTIVPNADAGPAVVNAIVMPLFFISGVFIPIDDGPQWIRVVAEVFPVRHYLVASIESFLGVDPGLNYTALGVMTLWGVGGLVIAARFFSWEPRQ